MRLFDHFEAVRKWFPVPVDLWRPRIGRWIVLDGDRKAVSLGLLVLTFVSIMVIGTVRPFEMQQLLTETTAVQTVLNTFMSGIILLVSIVVSINSIVLSHDITEITSQEERVEGLREFRNDIGDIAGSDQQPTDPGSFLHVMASVIKNHAQELNEVSVENGEPLSEDATSHVDAVVETAEQLEDRLYRTRGGEFTVLWLGLKTDYGPMMNSMRRLKSGHEEELSEEVEEHLDELLRLFELFATGREYFKTLYYNQEVSELSRTLLMISLPAIISTATAILAIDAGLLPDVWLVGLPPLLTFVAVTITVALTPYIVLTAYMLRLATVTRRTAAAGPFVLQR